MKSLANHQNTHNIYEYIILLLVGCKNGEDHLNLAGLEIPPMAHAKSQYKIGGIAAFYARIRGGKA